MKKKMLLEAQKRLGILLDMGLKDEVTNVFEEHSLEYLTKETTLLGVGIINFSFDDAEDLKNVKELFEEQYDCLVYYGILTSTSNDKCLSPPSQFVSLHLIFSINYENLLNLFRHVVFQKGYTLFLRKA